MNNLQKTFIIILLLILFFRLLLFINSNDRKIMKDLKSEKIVLSCNMKDGYRDINSSKIIDIDETRGLWIFTNGYANISNCELNKNKKE